MSDLFDYLTWRGDLSFGSVSLCPVDALIFSMLPYVRMEGIIPTSPHAEPIRLGDAVKAYLEKTAEPVSAIGENHLRLLRTLQSAPRFAPLRLLAAQKQLDAESGMQFAAVTVLLPGQNLFVAFEGTDDTLIGWEEDFRMSYECPVPAQLRALEYLRTVAAAHPMRRIYVGGHSKGGNLAMYAAVHCGPEYRHRIRAVYNNDGPGFCDDTISSPPYLELRDRTLPEVDLWSAIGEDTLEGVYFKLLHDALDTESEKLQRQLKLAARISRQILDGQEVVLP